MKTLFVLRHAKSSWDDAALTDFDRPLNDRGRKAAPFIGEKMRGLGLFPDLMVCSPAARAKQTAILVSRSAGLNLDILYDSRIYEASASALSKVVGERGGSAERLMLVGHNPGIESLITWLTGRTEPMPTAALAEITLDVVDWEGLAPQLGSLIRVIRPKEEMNRQ